MYICKRIKKVDAMTIVSTRGLTPESDEKVAEKPKRDVTAEICRGMKDWKEYLETGKSTKFRPAEELIDELRNSGL